MVSFVSSLFLTAQLFLLAHAEYDERDSHHRGGDWKQWQNEKEDGCVKEAGRNESMCQILSANCTWSVEKQICYSNRTQHGGKGPEAIRQRGGDAAGKQHDRNDDCTRSAGRNESMCKDLSVNCTWSVERNMCHSTRTEHGESNRDTHRQYGGGRGRKDHDKDDVCIKAAGRNESMCKALSANCTWSVRKEICHTTHTEHDEKDRDTKRQHGRDWKGQHHDREDACIEAAGRNESVCRSLSANCTWSVQREVCHSTLSDSDRDGHDAHHPHGGNRERNHRNKEDMCFERAGHDEDKCKALAAGKCAWSVVRSICYFTHEDGEAEGSNQEREHRDRTESCNGDCDHREESVNAGLDKPFLQEDGRRSEVNSEITLTLRLSNIQFSLLSANPLVLSQLRSKVKGVIANVAGEGVQPDHVRLVLEPGSVIILASVSTSSLSADAVQHNLDDSQMLQNIVGEVGAIDGIEAATTGDVSASIVSAPTVVSSPTTPAPADSKSKAPADSKAKLSFIIGSVAGGVAMLSLISASCFLYRRVSRSGRKDTQPQISVIGKDFQLDV